MFFNKDQKLNQTNIPLKENTYNNEDDFILKSEKNRNLFLKFSENARKKVENISFNFDMNNNLKNENSLNLAEIKNTNNYNMITNKKENSNYNSKNPFVINNLRKSKNSNLVLDYYSKMKSNTESKNLSYNNFTEKNSNNKLKKINDRNFQKDFVNSYNILNSNPSYENHELVVKSKIDNFMDIRIANENHKFDDSFHNNLFNDKNCDFEVELKNNKNNCTETRIEFELHPFDIHNNNRKYDVKDSIINDNYNNNNNHNNFLEKNKPNKRVSFILPDGEKINDFQNDIRNKRKDIEYEKYKYEEKQERIDLPINDKLENNINDDYINECLNLYKKTIDFNPITKFTNDFNRNENDKEEKNQMNFFNPFNINNNLQLNNKTNVNNIPFQKQENHYLFNESYKKEEENYENFTQDFFFERYGQFLPSLLTPTSFNRNISQFLRKDNIDDKSVASSRIINIKCDPINNKHNNNFNLLNKINNYNQNLNCDANKKIKKDKNCPENLEKNKLPDYIYSDEQMEKLEKFNFEKLAEELENAHISYRLNPFCNNNQKYFDIENNDISNLNIPNSLLFKWICAYNKLLSNENFIKEDKINKIKLINSELIFEFIKNLLINLNSFDQDKNEYNKNYNIHISKIISKLRKNEIMQILFEFYFEYSLYAKNNKNSTKNDKNKFILQIKISKFIDSIKIFECEDFLGDKIQIAYILPIDYCEFSNNNFNSMRKSPKIDDIILIKNFSNSYSYDDKKIFYVYENDFEVL